jgi:hypothetical protein
MSVDYEPADFIANQRLMFAEIEKNLENTEARDMGADERAIPQRRLTPP